MRAYFPDDDSQGSGYAVQGVNVEEQCHEAAEESGITCQIVGDEELSHLFPR